MSERTRQNLFSKESLDVLNESMYKLARDDKDAFAEIYRLTSGKINALLMIMLKDRSIVEEVLQDVYLKLWNKRTSFDPERGTPTAWLITIARNKAIDRMRAMRANLPLAPLELLEVIDPHPSAFEALSSAQRNLSLFHCIGTLEEKHQYYIKSAFFSGFTYEALAQREGVSIGTMKSWIRRSLLKLRTCLNASE